MLQGNEGQRLFRDGERAGQRVEFCDLEVGDKIVVRIHSGYGFYARFKAREYCGTVESIEPNGKIKLKTRGALYDGRDVHDKYAHRGQILRLTLQLTVSGRVVSMVSRGRPEMQLRDASGRKVVRRGLPGIQRRNIGYVLAPNRQLAA